MNLNDHLQGDYAFNYQNMIDGVHSLGLPVYQRENKQSLLNYIR